MRFEGVPMIPRLSTVILAALLAFSLPCASQEIRRLDFTVKPFEAMGEADPEFVETLSNQLMGSIERRSDFHVSASISAPYYLKGQVTADKKRQMITLQLFESRTDRVVWVGNYDQRRTTVDMMADDIIEAMTYASPSDVWP